VVDCPSHQHLDLLGHGHVDLDKEGVAASGGDRRRRLFALGCAAVGHDDARASAGEGLGTAATDPAACPGDDRHPLCETHHTPSASEAAASAANSARSAG
jgi:hypothetical protein